MGAAQLSARLVGHGVDSPATRARTVCIRLRLHPIVADVRDSVHTLRLLGCCLPEVKPQRIELVWSLGQRRRRHVVEHGNGVVLCEHAIGDEPAQAVGGLVDCRVVLLWWGGRDGVGPTSPQRRRRSGLLPASAALALDGDCVPAHHSHYPFGHEGRRDRGVPPAIRLKRCGVHAGRQDEVAAVGLQVHAGSRVPDTSPPGWTK